MDELRLEQEQPKKAKVEFGKRGKKKLAKDIAQIVTLNLKKDFTVKDGKVELIDGRWMTPRQILEEVKAQMRFIPEMYDQGATVDECDVSDKNTCGTVACIAGWIGLLTTGRDHCFEAINQFLVGEYRWPWLFDASWTDTDEQEAIYYEYSNATDGAGRVEAACKAIDLFIKEHDLK